MTAKHRNLPNILITGTPGVGKSTISKLLSERIKYPWREVSKLAEEYSCLDEYDPEYQCPFLNEDKLLDIMEGMMAKGGNIVDYHGCEFFPERWFDGVFVIRANNTTLYDRLSARGYTGKKLEDNIQCEIFETLLEEAQSSYKPEIVQELQNNTEEQLHSNVEGIVQWIERWKEDNI
ncbi:adenylate kinase isoenzyme 6 homolog [Pararge aegeria]|uniref:Adenylate kinase isoenzyme 6 homolog n=2 Tax=Pararge aegeria TaxID=116150 RepID=A0A8S4RTZ5_9NEOP|nr:adenylate kinase isoenzyme 6 homolog [Pararge aegeria]CAH2241079.1 jg13137 [Pararge aegeria aegeria]